MIRVDVRDVRNYALRGVTASFPSGRLSVVLGPNGAGKTTLLKVIAGLTDYEGSVLFDGVPVDDVPPFRRGVSYVPQNPSLFINMNVWENVAFGLKVRGVEGNALRERVSRLLKALRIEHLASSYPASLSGGEARKVAIARALAVDPKVLLLDEPLTGLDVEARMVTEQEVMSLIRKLSITVIMVTHEVGRGLGMADTIHVLWNGEILYSGKPSELNTSTFPEDAAFWLGTTIDNAEVIADGGLCYAVLGDFKVPVKCVTEGLDGGKRRVLIPVSDVKICRKGPIKGVVKRVLRSERAFRVVVSVGDAEMYVLTPFNLSPGDEVGLRINGCVVLG